VPASYSEKELTGRVITHLAAKGSKSERQAIFLETADKSSYLLRRRGGNPFFDPILQKLVGKTIHCKGILTEHTYIISDWSEIKG
jgi:hypothetical protein